MTCAAHLTRVEQLRALCDELAAADSPDRVNMLAHQVQNVAKLISDDAYTAKMESQAKGKNR